MTAGRICIREVDLADGDETARAAGQRMATRGVGTLFVLDDDRRPVGVLTDRDLALRVVGTGADPGTTKVSEVMTTDVGTVAEETPIEDALVAMRRLGVRRVAVVDDDGRLTGVLSVDDVLALLAEEFGSLGHILARSNPLQAAG